MAGLLVVVDIRRGLGDFDWQMLDWAGQLGCGRHVLLTKADKLKRGASIDALNRARRELDEDVSVQLFSATKRTGLDEARKAIEAMLATGS